MPAAACAVPKTLQHVDPGRCRDVVSRSDDGQSVSLLPSRIIWLVVVLLAGDLLFLANHPCKDLFVLDHRSSLLPPQMLNFLHGHSALVNDLHPRHPWLEVGETVDVDLRAVLSDDRKGREAGQRPALVRTVPTPVQTPGNDVGVALDRGRNQLPLPFDDARQRDPSVRIDVFDRADIRLGKVADVSEVPHEQEGEQKRPNRWQNDDDEEGHCGQSLGEGRSRARAAPEPATTKVSRDVRGWLESCA